MSGNFLQILQELVKCKKKQTDLEETVKKLELENRKLRIENGTLHGKVNMLEAKNYGDVLVLQELFKRSVVEAKLAKQSFMQRTKELEAKLKAAETGKRKAEGELADWKKGLECLEKLCDEEVGKESEDDVNASVSAEFERVEVEQEQVFKDLRVGPPLETEIIDLTQTDDDDDEETDTTGGDGVLGVDQSAFVLRRNIKIEQAECNEGCTDCNDGDDVDVPDLNCSACANDEVGLPKNCDVIVTEGLPEVVSIKSEGEDLFSFQADSNENDSPNINQGFPPETSSRCTLKFPPAQSSAVIHERVFLKEPGIFCRCGKEFSKNAKIQQHIYRYKNHHRFENRKFYCKKCGKRFTFGSQLRVHIWKKHNAMTVGGSYCCGKCGGQFATRSFLYKHQIRRQHRNVFRVQGSCR